MIVVQHITLWWTKASRSAPGSAVRNAVPELFDLPFRPATMAATGVAYHSVLIREWLGFGHREDASAALPADRDGTFHVGCLRIRPGADRADVVYTYGLACAGAPERTPMPRTVLSLRPGQWGRVVYNGRFEGARRQEWLYRKVVVNVAHLTGDEETVYAGRPSKEFSDLAILR